MVARRKATDDPQVREALLEAAVQDRSETGNSELLERAVRNLGEEGMPGSTMSETWTVDENDDSYTTVYSTVDGTPSTILKSMLPKVMRKRIPRDNDIPTQNWGKLAFDFEPPLDLPERTLLKCFLHPQHPLRDTLDTIGLHGKTCNKSNLPNEYERRQHERSHKREQEAYQDWEYQKKEDARLAREHERDERMAKLVEQIASRNAG